MATKTYGNIILPEPGPGLIASLRETQAKALADELSWNRSEYGTINTNDAAQAVAYVEQWYTYDYDRRCWRPDPSKIFG